MEYYSALKKNEILPFMTTWMDLEDIMLSEIRQRKAHIIWFHLYVKSKKQNKWTNTWKPEIDFINTENKLVVARGRGVVWVGKIGEGN